MAGKVSYRDLELVDRRVAEEGHETGHERVAHNGLPLRQLPLRRSKDRASSFAFGGEMPSCQSYVEGVLLLPVSSKIANTDFNDILIH